MTAPEGVGYCLAVKKQKTDRDHGSGCDFVAERDDEAGKRNQRREV